MGVEGAALQAGVHVDSSLRLVWVKAWTVQGPSAEGSWAVTPALDVKSSIGGSDRAPCTQILGIEWLQKLCPGYLPCLELSALLGGRILSLVKIQILQPATNMFVVL